MHYRLIALAAAAGLLTGGAGPASAFDLGIVAFQMSSETHARCANAAEAAAKEKGWTATVLNSNGALPTHAQQIEDLTQKKVNGIILCMSKPVQLDAQLAAAKKAGIPVISVMSGGSTQTLFDIEDNEYAAGATSALYLLGKIGYEGKILTERFEGNVGTRIRGKELDLVLSENTGVTVAGSHSMAKTASWQDDVRKGMQALILQNAGGFKGVWASFDGQAFIIDDLLKDQGMKKGDVALVSTDGGPEAFRRIKDPESMLTATVAIPFDAMGKAAVDDMEKIAVKGASKESIVSGPYLYMPAELVDASNVDQFLKK
jgi:simple sugar transport system substrate-binding protein/ribose transport system substrate-binding protein